MSVCLHYLAFRTRYPKHTHFLFGLIMHFEKYTHIYHGFVSVWSATQACSKLEMNTNNPITAHNSSQVIHSF